MLESRFSEKEIKELLIKNYQNFTIERPEKKTIVFL